MLGEATVSTVVVVDILLAVVSDVPASDLPLLHEANVKEPAIKAKLNLVMCFINCILIWLWVIIMPKIRG
jgi:hypothetical protein